ncbi:MAG: hypothetical protein ACFFB2_07475 [Promethearchaeota archaeon]
MKRGGGLLEAIDLGNVTEKKRHGLRWAHNFGVNIDDFELNFNPYCSNIGSNSYIQQNLLIVSP